MASKAVIAMAAHNVFPSGNFFVLKNPVDQFVGYPVTNHKSKKHPSLATIRDVWAKYKASKGKRNS